MTIREKYLSRIPQEIKRFGSAANPLMVVYGMKIIIASLHSPGDKFEVLVPEKDE